MASKLKYEFLVALGLSALLPFVVASVMLFEWSRSDQELTQIHRQDDRARITQTARSSLERVAVVTDMAAQSREVLDFILAPKSSRPYAENLLIGRFLDLSKRASEIAGWRIYDGHGAMLYPDTKGEVAIKPGFSKHNDGISYISTISLDDQYLASGSVTNKGFLEALIPTAQISEKIPGLKAITKFGDNDSLSSLEIEVSEQPPGTRPVVAAIIIVAVVMVISLSIGLGLFYRKILRPIERLTDEVLAKHPNPSSISLMSKGHEILLLKDVFETYIREMEVASRNAAIAQMTQMLAHDVRKPFSLLRMALGMLAQAKDPEAVQLLMSRIVPEMDKAMSSVDGMISDVMEVGAASTTLIREAASPESIIEATLFEIGRIYPKAAISFEYDFKHRHMAHVHVQKISRVFSNIVGNAFQAMRIKGSMWFRTSEHEGMIQFCVGNSGSVIPKESLSKLFEAFFTSGKKGGTGLGLAIAQKVVVAHGGKIWCESSRTAEFPDGKVEFFFTLPVLPDKLNRTTAALPRNSRDIANNLVFSGHNPPSLLSVDKGELTLENDIVQALTAANRTLHILIVDDEAIYRSALSTFLTRTEVLGCHVTLTQAQDSDEALKALSSRTYDLVVTDVDMGVSSLNGFDLVSELRKRGSGALICVHSNRIVAADSKTAIDAGANYFMPKPMARAQLLRILLQAAAPVVLSTSNTIAKVTTALGTTSSVPVKPQSLSTKPAVLIVDDSPMTLYAWEEVLAPDAVVFTMKSFEDLMDKIDSDSNFIGELTYVITDMHLDGSAGDGLDVGRLIKGLRPSLPVLMSSDETFDDGELVGVADKVIPKEPVDLAELRIRSVANKKGRL
jgi:signal transduction histidine kinase/DNA-binding response OmpR family regulator